MKTLILITLTLVSLTSFSQDDRQINKLMNSEPSFIDSTVTRTETIYIYDFKGDRLILTRNNTIPYEKRLTFTYGLKKRSNDYVKTLCINEETLNRIINYNCELKNRK